jgi:hypothetical protein
LATDLLTHAAEQFNACAKEMDSQLARLALFLDPRYAKAAFTDQTWETLLRTVSSMAAAARTSASFSHWRQLICMTNIQLTAHPAGVWGLTCCCVTTNVACRLSSCGRAVGMV